MSISFIKNIYRLTNIHTSIASRPDVKRALELSPSLPRGTVPKVEKDGNDEDVKRATKKQRLDDPNYEFMFGAIKELAANSKKAAETNEQRLGLEREKFELEKQKAIRERERDAMDQKRLDDAAKREDRRVQEQLILDKIKMAKELMGMPGMDDKVKELLNEVKSLRAKVKAAVVE